MSLLDDEDTLLDETSYETISAKEAKEAFSKFMVIYPYKLQHLYVHVDNLAFPEKLNTTNACKIISEVLGDYPCRVYDCASSTTYNDFKNFIKKSPSRIIVFREFSAILDSERKKFGEFIKEHSDKRNLEDNSTSHARNDNPRMLDEDSWGNNSHPDNFHFIFVDGPEDQLQVYEEFYPVLYGEFFKITIG